MFKRFVPIALTLLAVGCGSTTDTQAPASNSQPPPLNVTFVDHTASLRGSVSLGQDVYVGPFARLDGPIQVGDRSNVQDNTSIEGTVFIGRDSAVAHGARVVGPARLEGQNFVAFNSLVEGATLEQGSALELMSRVGPGIRLRGMRVLPGKNVTTQAQADDPALGKVLPVNAALEEFLQGVVKVNVELAHAYNVLERERGVPLGIGPNPITQFAPRSILPLLAGMATSDPTFRNRLVGDVQFPDSVAELGVKMGFRDAVRADEGQDVHLGRLGSMGDEVTFHALEDTGIDAGGNCHFGHHCVIHGGADDTVGSEGTVLGDEVRVGDGAIVFRSIVGTRTVIGARAIVDRCNLPPGTVIGPGEIWIGDQLQGRVEW